MGVAHLYEREEATKGMTRVRRVETERELEKEIDEFITRGYEIKEQGQYSAKVKKKDWGSAPVHGFLFLFSLIIAAVVVDQAGISGGVAWIVAIGASVGYALYSRLTAEEVIFKIEGDRDTP